MFITCLLPGSIVACSYHTHMVCLCIHLLVLMKLITLVSLRMTCSLRSLRSEFAFLSSLSICFVIATVCGGWQAVWLCCHDNSKLCASMCGIHCLIALISVHFQSLGTLSCMLIFLNFSDVSRMFSFLLLYYYLCILDVMIRLPLVLV